MMVSSLWTCPLCNTVCDSALQPCEEFPVLTASETRPLAKDDMRTNSNSRTGHRYTSTVGSKHA